MIRADDIEDAVAAGILTVDQARALEQLATHRRNTRLTAVGREERFRLLGGFNDFFIAIGVVMLAVGLSSVPLLGVPVMWGLAEYLTGRLRLVAPSIVLVAALAILTGMGAANLAHNQPDTITTVVGFGSPVLVVAAHYWRFRLPFSLFVLSAAGVGFILALLAAVLTQQGLPKEAVNQWSIWVALVLGIGVFIWAMTFDVSDTARITRRADCGFWLHLLAAPLIMHPLAGPLLNSPLVRAGKEAAVTSTSIGLVVLLVASLSVVALVVDRRALLVAGLSYLGAALAYTLSKLTGASPASYTILILLLLGTLIVTLGVGWQPIRAALMSVLPGGAWKKSVPPYAV